MWSLSFGATNSSFNVLNLLEFSLESYLCLVTQEWLSWPKYPFVAHTIYPPNNWETMFELHVTKCIWTDTTDASENTYAPLLPLLQSTPQTQCKMIRNCLNLRVSNQDLHMLGLLLLVHLLVFLTMCLSCWKHHTIKAYIASYTDQNWTNTHSFTL